MIYEMRTYDLKPRSVPEVEKRTAEKLPGRLNYSKLGGFWHTEAGPLNQIIHVWPYDDLNQRNEIRAKATADGAYPPNTSEFIVNMQTDILIPAQFMTPLGDRKIGPLYEMRIYTYAPGDIPKLIEAWGRTKRNSTLSGDWSRDRRPHHRTRIRYRH